MKKIIKLSMLLIVLLSSCTTNNKQYINTQESQESQESNESNELHETHEIYSSISSYNNVLSTEEIMSEEKIYRTYDETIELLKETIVDVGTTNIDEEKLLNKIIKVKLVGNIFEYNNYLVIGLEQFDMNGWASNIVLANNINDQIDERIKDGAELYVKLTKYISKEFGSSFTSVQLFEYEIVDIDD